MPSEYQGDPPIEPPSAPRTPAPSESGGGGSPAGHWFFPEGTDSAARDPQTTGDFKPSGDSDAPAKSRVGLPPGVPATFGRYEVRSLHGEGGFGAVYVGYDPQLHRKVAIKVPRFYCAPGEIEEFLHEARKLARLRHPGIVTVYDVGVQDGLSYIISDFIEGMSLRQYLRSAPPWTEVARILAAVADALAHAHANSTIHRDIKPSNIMLTREGRPVLLDFGLALTDREAAARRDRRVSGTPSYMSPEQAAGSAHRVDGRTDIYSLGVVLYEGLCGRRPFRADDMGELFRQIQQDEPQPPRQLAPAVPPDLEAICLKAMAKQLRDRYSTAGDMAKDLRRVVRSAVKSGVSGSFGFPAPTEFAPPPSWSPEVSESSDLSGRPTKHDPLSPPVARPFGSSSALEPTPPRAEDSRAREAQRRQVTVLYCTCDWLDSTTSVDPEEQQAALRDFQRLCNEAVQALQGTLVQSTGQGLLVCFGFPQAFEDAAQRAVRTGLAILREVTSRREQSATGVFRGLAVWLTIHSGLALVGDVEEGGGGSQLAVVGEARNVATRLESIAQPDTLVISDATLKLVQGFFVCKSLGLHPIKGMPKPLEVYQVLRPSKAQSRIDVAGLTGLTPLVGRDQEVGLLRDRWEQAKEGMGQIVLLIGEPGIGKSRLVHVVKEHVVKESEGRTESIVEWRCSPYYQNTGLYPASDYFARMLGLNPEEPASERLTRLAAHLEEYGLGAADVAPLFATLLSIPYADRYPLLNLTPQRQKDRTLEVLLEWTRRYAQRHALLFIVEDLHWVDPSTLEFLGLLVEQGFADRVLTILTFRPEFTTPWTSRAHLTQVALNRLTKRQIADLMQRKSGVTEMPPAIVDQVAARTDGVPLFVEEFTKMIMESGMLRAGDGSSKLSGTFPLHAIPATLQDLLMARVDRIAGARDVIQVAAALGREFSYELLCAVAEVPSHPTGGGAPPEEALQRELAKLVEAEILYPKGRPPRCQYLFKHALIQDAAYQSLVKSKRQDFHTRIAGVLEMRFPATAEAQPELLAHHYSEAALPAQAVGYWEKAAKASLARFANAEAISHLTKGLEALATLPDTPDRDRRELALQVPLAMAIMTARGWAAPDVEPVHARARALCLKLGERASLFWVMWGSWAWRLLRVELDIAKRLADELLETALPWNDAGLLLEAHWAIGCTSLFRGEFARGHEHFSKASALLDPERCRANARSTGQNVVATLPAHWCWVLWHLGLPDRALRVGQEGAEQAKRLADPFSYAFAVYHLGCVQQHCRLPRETLKSAATTLAIAQEQGFAIWKGLGTLCRGAGLALDGKPLEGAEIIRQGLAFFQATGAGLSGTHYFCQLAEALGQGGRFDEACRAVEDGLKVVERTNERFAEAELHRLQGELLLARAPDHVEQAESCFQKAMDIAHRQLAKAWELRATMSRCRLMARQGRGQEARTLLATVYDSFTEGLQTKDLLDARELLGRLMAGPS